MTFSFPVPGLLMLLSAIWSLLLALYALRRAEPLLGMPLFLMFLASAIWSFFAGLELIVDPYPAMRATLALSYPGISTIAVFFFIFSVRFCGMDHWFSPARYAMLFIIPLLTTTLVVTNELHHWYYLSTFVGETTHFTYLILEFGPFWLIHVLYSYGMLLAGIILLMAQYYKVSRAERSHVLFFLTGSLLPFIANIVYVIGFRPYGFLDITPIAFLGMGVILLAGILSRRLFNMVPFALDHLIQNIPDPIFVLDNKQSIAHLNEAAEKLLISGQESSHEQRSGELPSWLTHQEKGTEIQWAGKFFDIKRRAITDKNQNHLATLVLMRDVSDEKEVEKQFYKNEQRLEELNAAKNRFFSIIADDLRSPFTSVLGFSQLLCEETEDHPQQAISEYARHIRQSSEKAMKLLDDLMTWAQSQTGKINIKLQVLDVLELVRETLELYEKTAAQKSVKLQQNIPAGVKILADRHMACTILRNLVDNAIKYTLSGGSVTLTCRQTKSNACIEIRDTGIGMKPEVMKGLFDQDENNTRVIPTVKSGTGLGLIISHEFIQKMGGGILVESEEGAGSVFTVCLPVPQPRSIAD